MKDWKLKITLHSGKEYVVSYKTSKTHLNYVSEEIFDDNNGKIVDFTTCLKQETIFIRRSEIASIEFAKE